MSWTPLDDSYRTIMALYHDAEIGWSCRVGDTIDVPALVRLGDSLVGLATRLLATRTVANGRRAATCHRRAIRCYEVAGMRPELIRVSTCDDFEAFTRREGPR